MPIFMQSSSLKPAARATRSVMPSANATLSSSVSMVTSMRLAPLDIVFMGNRAPLISIAHLEWGTKAPRRAFATSLGFRESGPVGPVQRPVLDRLAQMARRDLRCGIQVRDRARHLQNPVVRARRKPQPRYRGFQQLFAFGRNAAVFANQFRRHLRVRVDALLPRESFQLPAPRLHHALAHRGRIL